MDTTSTMQTTNTTPDAPRRTNSLLVASRRGRVCRHLTIVGYLPACFAILMAVFTVGCSRDKGQPLKYTDPARRLTADGYRDPDRVVLIASYNDPRLLRAEKMLQERGIKVFGGGDLGMMEVAVDVDDEEAAREMLRSVPEFKELIVTNVKYIPK